MPDKSFKDGQLKRLSDPKYSSLYLKTAFDEIIKDGNIQALFLALKNVAEATRNSKKRQHQK